MPSLLKAHILLSLSNHELTFILAFCRLVNINTNDNFLKKHLLSYREHLKMASNIFINSPKYL